MNRKNRHERRRATAIAQKGFEGFKRRQQEVGGSGKSVTSARIYLSLQLMMKDPSTMDLGEIAAITYIRKVYETGNDPGKAILCFACDRPVGVPIFVAIISPTIEPNEEYQISAGLCGYCAMKTSSPEEVQNLFLAAWQKHADPTARAATMSHGPKAPQ